MTQAAVDEKTAAKYIGMSVHFLRAARMNGQIGNRAAGPNFLKIGRSVRYAIADLDCWLQEHRQERAV